jgi:pimeloyl-ACP methyl ester carboxylesterase
MRHPYRRVLTLPLLFLLASAASAYQSRIDNPQQTPSRPLWGELLPGRYRVGFRTIFRFDTSRTWRRSRDYMGNFSPDPDGRPVQLNVWYPAIPQPNERQMTLGTYLDEAAPAAAFAPLTSIMRQRNQANWESSVPPAQLPALRATPTYAWTEARPAPGRFPAVLYFGGLNADMNSNAVLSEFLASHGYVVASISLIGRASTQTSQSRSPSDLDASVRDMEFAWAVIGAEFNTDRTRLAVLGHSLGGVEALMFAMRNGNVSAVVGLDGTYGFKGSTGVLTDSWGYDPRNMRAAFLDLRRAQGQQEADLDLAPVRSFRYADLTIVTMVGMHHSDFTSFPMVARRFGIPILPKYANTGWNRDTAQRGHQQAAQIIVEFLNEHVTNERSDVSLQEMVRGIQGTTFAHFDAGPAMPSPEEAIAIVNDRGVEALKALMVRVCGKQGVTSCVDADVLNSKGYELLGQHRGNDAVVLFEIAAWSHPLSANAQDSLADGYAAVGNSESARKAIQRAIQLVPEDPGIGAQSKASFLAEEKRRLDQMR